MNKNLVQEILKDIPEMENLIENLTSMYKYSLMIRSEEERKNLNIDINNIRYKLLNSYELICKYLSKKDRDLLKQELYNKVIISNLSISRPKEKYESGLPIEKDDYYHKCIKKPFIKKTFKIIKNKEIPESFFNRVVVRYLIEQAIENYSNKFKKQVEKYQKKNQTEVSIAGQVYLMTVSCVEENQEDDLKNLQESYNLFSEKVKDYFFEYNLFNMFYTIYSFFLNKNVTNDEVKRVYREIDDYFFIKKHMIDKNEYGTTKYYEIINFHKEKLTKLMIEIQDIYIEEMK